VSNGTTEPFPVLYIKSMHVSYTDSQRSAWGSDGRTGSTPVVACKGGQCEGTSATYGTTSISAWNM
jgi:hypothetical protein